MESEHLCSVDGCIADATVTSHNGPMGDPTGCHCLCTGHFDDGYMG